MTKSYDIIGDIHGHADALEALLTKLGYEECSGAFGAFRHPGGRCVVFLGDYIDRGPKIRRVLEIVRSMVEAGSALAILGNHEVNALRYHAVGSKGSPLRPHSPKNRSQHLATIDQLADPDPEQWRGWLEWFARLPLWLDLGGFRVVHAAWDEVAIAEGCARHTFGSYWLAKYQDRARLAEQMGNTVEFIAFLDLVRAVGRIVDFKTTGILD